MEKKNIPTHDPYTGELNPYYEELTGEPNPLIIIKGNVLMDSKTPNHDFFIKKAEEFCGNEHADSWDYFSHVTAFMEGVKSVMKEILTEDEYTKFIKK
jgi:hypothetical protein